MSACIPPMSWYFISETREVAFSEFMSCGSTRQEEAEKLGWIWRGRVFDFNFKSKQEERECQYSFTVVVAPQHATGNDVHPINYHIMKTVDGLDRVWRGNVLVFKRGKSRNRPFVDIQPADIVALEWVIP
ncbi:hypothetical protein R3P38DRAFT_2790622, partial [Favolaschia claudopus]